MDRNTKIKVIIFEVILVIITIALVVGIILTLNKTKECKVNPKENEACITIEDIYNLAEQLEQEKTERIAKEQQEFEQRKLDAIVKEESQVTPLDYELEQYIIECCDEYNVPFELVCAIIEHESQFDVNAINEYNYNYSYDYGLMQINSCNLEVLESELGIDDIMDTRQNVLSGIYILSQHVEKYDDIHRVLMSYNMGASRTRELWNDGIYSSGYSREVVAEMDKYIR